MSSSLLTAIGLPELITHSLKEYEQLAIDLATNPSKLQDTRNKLQENKKTMPLFDTKRFVLNLETAYEMMWDRYTSGKPPKQLVVKEARKPKS